MKYEFRVGSSKFELEAINDDVAYFSMIMFFKDALLPIAIYKPHKKVIIGKNILDMDKTESFIEKNLIELRKTRASIKELESVKENDRRNNI